MIIAVDFDGILCEDKFPEIGVPNYNMISYIRELIDEGHEVILWTSRAGERLEEAVAWCEDRGLHFCAVNCNAPSNVEEFKEMYPDPSPKVYADIYIEDHSPHFVRMYDKAKNNKYNTNDPWKEAVSEVLYDTMRVVKLWKAREN